MEKLKVLSRKFGLENSVMFLDWKDNVEDYLQAMDIFCLPSHFEGLPISAIEAQASGVRCLISENVTREVQITDLVRFLPLEEESWAEELAGCTKDLPRDRQDEKIAKAGYDIQVAARKLEKLYEHD